MTAQGTSTAMRRSGGLRRRHGLAAALDRSGAPGLCWQLGIAGYEECLRRPDPHVSAPGAGSGHRQSDGAAPGLLILAVLAMRGSLRAYLLWLGVLTFTVYNYVIYAFSIPFGPMFLLWVAVLGLCLFALIGGVTTVDQPAIAESFANRRAIVVVAWSLIVIAILFGLLWLSEDVPALLAGGVPQSVRDMALPTNPVHVLDLAFFLPAVITIGVQLLRRRPFAFTVAPCSCS